MGMSATVLGVQVGLTGPEMNQALSQAGLLEGKPQAWGVTDEGMKYATEERKWNGVGGHKQYIIDYDLRTWNPKVLDVLDLTDETKQAAREAAADARRQAREATAALAVDLSAGTETSIDEAPDSTDVMKAVIVVVGVATVAYVVYKVAPHLKRRWDERRARPERPGG